MPCRLSVWVSLPLAWWNHVVHQHWKVFLRCCYSFFFFLSYKLLMWLVPFMDYILFEQEITNRASRSGSAVKTKKKKQPKKPTKKQPKTKTSKSTSCRAKKNIEILVVSFSYLGFHCSNVSKSQSSWLLIFPGGKRNRLYFCNMLSLLVCLRFTSISCFQPEQYLFPLKKPLVILALLSFRLAQKCDFQIKRLSAVIRLSL